MAEKTHPEHNQLDPEELIDLASNLAAELNETITSPYPISANARPASELQTTLFHATNQAVEQLNPNTTPWNSLRQLTSILINYPNVLNPQPTSVAAKNLIPILDKPKPKGSTNARIRYNTLTMTITLLHRWMGTDSLPTISAVANSKSILVRNKLTAILGEYVSPNSDLDPKLSQEIEQVLVRIVETDDDISYASHNAPGPKAIKLLGIMQTDTSIDFLRTTAQESEHQHLYRESLSTLASIGSPRSELALLEIVTQEITIEHKLIDALKALRSTMWRRKIPEIAQDRLLSEPEDALLTYKVGGHLKHPHIEFNHLKTLMKMLITESDHPQTLLQQLLTKGQNTRIKDLAKEALTQLNFQRNLKASRHNLPK